MWNPLRSVHAAIKKVICYIPWFRIKPPSIIVPVEIIKPPEEKPKPPQEKPPEPPKKRYFPEVEDVYEKPFKEEEQKESLPEVQKLHENLFGAVSSDGNNLSLLNFGLPWWTTLPEDDGAWDTGDKQHMLGLYSGVIVFSSVGAGYNLAMSLNKKNISLLNTGFKKQITVG